MKYHNFDLYVEEKDEAGYRLRANAEMFDSAHGLMQLDPDSAGIKRARQRFAERHTDSQFLIEIGTLLYNALFSAEGRDIYALFEQCSGKFLHAAHEGIRLRLRIEAPEIAALPWEFLYSPDNDTFLGTWIHTPVVRYLDVGMPIHALETSLPMRILVVMPSSPDLDAAEERNILLRALEDVGPGVETTFLEGEVSLVQIEEALLENRFHIFHFIGHGDFVGDRGVLRLGTEADPVDHVTLGRLFQNHEDIKLVFLNACKGARVSPSKPFLGIAPQLVRRGVPAVVAMQYSIYDDVAVLFSRMFYECLFKGTDRGRIDMAVTHARNALLVEYPNERAFGAPVLFLRSPEGVLFDLPVGKKALPLPVSRREAGRTVAVARTYNYNIDMIRDSEADTPTKTAQIQNAEERIRQIHQTLKYRKDALRAATVVAFLVIFLSLMQFFDIFNWDTGIETYTVLLSDLFAHKQFHEDIVIIPIDEETKKEVGRERVDESWREDHALLVNNLSKAGAKVVVFDMAFEGDSASDAAFRDAIKKARERGTSVIVGVMALDGGKPVMAKELCSAVSGWGTMIVGTRLGHVRLAPLVIQKETEPVLGLAMRVFVAYEDGDKAVELIDFDQDRNHIMVRFDSETRQVKKLSFFESDTICEGNDMLSKGDALANLAIDLTPLSMIRDSSQRRAYTYIRDHPNPQTLTELQNKIVIVGVEDINDRRGDRWGFELHADALSTLLNGVVIRPVAFGGQFALIATLSFVGALIRTRMRHTSRRLRISLLMTVLLIYLGGTVCLYVQYGLLLNIVYHVIALLLSYWVVGKLERRCFR